MTPLVRSITFDCSDHYQLGQFWAAATGYGDAPDNPNFPDDPETRIVPPDGSGPALLFIPVPEGKVVKNRVHLDLQPQDRTRDEEVERLLGLGATLFADHREPDGSGFVVLADPEGNEFCVERSKAERGDTT